MLYPTIQELTKGQYNRYELVIATAKCARLITDEYVHQREVAEKAVAGNKDSEKKLMDMIDEEYRDQKAVKVAITHIYNGDYSVTPSSMKKGASEIPAKSSENGENLTDASANA